MLDFIYLKTWAKNFTAFDNFLYNCYVNNNGMKSQGITKPFRLTIGEGGAQE